MARKSFTEIASSSDIVGSISLRGIYGGAICNYWRCSKVENGFATYVPVKAVSVRNDDGTYSHRYEEETP
jgi:hypothetical protein